MPRSRDHRGERESFDSAPGIRHARVQRAVFEELSTLLRDEVTNPALDEVVIRAVALAADYGSARVEFSLSSPTPSREQILQASAGLERAHGFLRARLAESLDLKRTPTLKFTYTPGSAVKEEENAWWK